MLNLKKLLTKILSTINLYTEPRFTRFTATSGAVTANDYISFTSSYSSDNNVYLADSKTIRFRRSGFVRIEGSISAQTSSSGRLWLKLSQGNIVQNCINYGTYATCTYSTVAQVNTNTVVKLQSAEACSIDYGGLGPSVLMVTWLYYL